MTWSDRCTGVSCAAVRRALLSLAVLLPLVALGRAAERPTLRAGVLPDEFRMTGAVDDPAWRDAEAIENLTMIEPIEGGHFTTAC